MSVFLVLALVSQLVLWCVIAWFRVRLSVGYWLFCCVLDFPLLCDYYYYYYYYAEGHRTVDGLLPVT